METPTTQSLEKSDELFNKILATHANHVNQAVDLKPVLQIMEKILLDVDRVVNGSHGGTVTFKKNTSLTAFGEAISAAIHNVSCEEKMPRKQHLKLLKTLRNFSWNTKVMLALAAFTANLGEFWLLLQLGNTNSLANSVACLKQVPEIERLNAVRDGITNFVKTTRNLAECNAQFTKLRSRYFSEESKSEVIRATYCTIDIIVEITILFGCRNKLSINNYISNAIKRIYKSIVDYRNTKLTTEEGKTSIIQLEDKVRQIYIILQNHFECCKKNIDNDMVDAYESLLKLMQRPGGGDIEKILNRFLRVEGVQKVDIEKLRSKHVLFLISDLDISRGEIIALNELYQKAESYEIVWLPVVDRLYEDVIKYIKEVWHFTKNPIAVHLTPEGEVTCQNALLLLWTWGNEVFPSTAEREQTLWRDRYSRRLDFLDDLIDPELRKWIIDGRLICLYGCGSIDWILKFTTEIKVVLERSGVSVKMVYVGKNNAKEWTGKVIDELRNQNLRVLKSETHFWARLQSMLYTKMKQAKVLTGDDPFMLEVMKMLAYDGAGGWALFSKGADVVVSLTGETALIIIRKYGDWENNAKQRGFLEGLTYYVENQNMPHSCVQLKLPFVSSEVPGKVQCCECGQEMELYYMYRCCKE